MTDIQRPLISTYFNILPKTNNRIWKNQPFFFSKDDDIIGKPPNLHMFSPVPWFVWRNPSLEAASLGFQHPRWGESSRIAIWTSGSRTSKNGSDGGRCRNRDGGGGGVGGTRRVGSWWWLVAGFFGGVAFFWLVGKKGATQKKVQLGMCHSLRQPDCWFWSKVDGN